MATTGEGGVQLFCLCPHPLLQNRPTSKDPAPSNPNFSISPPGYDLTDLRKPTQPQRYGDGL